METMLCNTCKIEQPLDNFSNNKNAKYGKHWTCKSCIKAYQLKNRDKLKAYQHDYQKVYRVENKEKVIAYTKEWMANNRDKCNSYAKKSNEKNPQRMKDYMKVWNAKKKAEKLAQQNDQQ
jgi:geranylgeranyl pyrophosphate synthase